MHTVYGRSDRKQSKPIPTCPAVREAISARFDHERAALSDEAVANHITACDSCREFEPAFADLGRRVRVRPAISVPAPLLPLLRQSYTPARASIARQAAIRWRGGPPWARLTRWGVVAAPSAAAIAALSLAVAGGHSPVVPALTPTHCNSYLISHHLWSGY